MHAVALAITFSIVHSLADDLDDRDSPFYI